MLERLVYAKGHEFAESHPELSLEDMEPVKQAAFVLVETDEQIKGLPVRDRAILMHQFIDGAHDCYYYDGEYGQ